MILETCPICPGVRIGPKSAFEDHMKRHATAKTIRRERQCRKCGSWFALPMGYYLCSTCPSCRSTKRREAGNHRKHMSGKGIQFYETIGVKRPRRKHGERK